MNLVLAGNIGAILIFGSWIFTYLFTKIKNKQPYFMTPVFILLGLFTMGAKFLRGDTGLTDRHLDFLNWSLEVTILGLAAITTLILIGDYILTLKRRGFHKNDLRLYVIFILFVGAVILI
jgi:hypothetical protein